MVIQTSTMTGTSQVGRFSIRYTIQKDRDGNPTDLSANISDGASVVGTFSCNSKGELGLSVTERAAMTASERQAVIAQLLTDTNEIFGTNSQEEESEGE